MGNAALSCLRNTVPICASICGDTMLDAPSPRLGKSRGSLAAVVRLPGPNRASAASAALTQGRWPACRSVATPKRMTGQRVVTDGLLNMILILRDHLAD